MTSFGVGQNAGPLVKRERSASVSSEDVRLMGFKSGKLISGLATTSFSSRVGALLLVWEVSSEPSQKVDDRLPAIPSATNWMPPKCSSPEVEVFINNVRKDILEPQNLRTVKDNLTKDERLALRNLKSSDKVIRIQDKGSRFVILNQEEYQDKMLGQLNNNLHYNKVK